MGFKGTIEAGLEARILGWHVNVGAWLRLARQECSNGCDSLV